MQGYFLLSEWRFNNGCNQQVIISELIIGIYNTNIKQYKDGPARAQRPPGASFVETPRLTNREMRRYDARAYRREP